MRGIPRLPCQTERLGPRPPLLWGLGLRRNPTQPIHFGERMGKRLGDDLKKVAAAEPWLRSNSDHPPPSRPTLLSSCQRQSILGCCRYQNHCGNKFAMPGERIRLLALDGGGVRGLASLMILQQLMATVDPTSPPKPCDYFDMIGGTSTGGLIAVMLGCLQMTVDECIQAYTALSDKVFEKKAHRVKINGQLQGRFDTAALEQAIKKILRDRGRSEDILLKDVDAPCKVHVHRPFRLTHANLARFVCATSKQTGDTVCLTTYRSPRSVTHLFDSTRIWQACRATCAATTFFDHIAIGPFGEEFIDGALGMNNPIYALWNQAQDIWGPDQLQSKLRCIVSIGTGVPTLQLVRDDVLGIWSTLKQLATDTEKAAEQFRRDKSSLDDGGRYYRFNVDHGLENIGLEESKRKKEIAAATGRYIQSQAVFKQMKACANNLTGKEC